eukprot:PhM_4_TR4545/c0_g2_i1/m.6550
MLEGWTPPTAAATATMTPLTRTTRTPQQVHLPNPRLRQRQRRLPPKKGAVYQPATSTEPPTAVLLAQAGALISGIRTELLTLSELEELQTLPWASCPGLRETVNEQLVKGYRHKALVAEQRFRTFRSRQHILFDRTFLPWEKLFFGDCPETDVGGVKFCVSFDYRDGKFGAFLKFHHKFDKPLPIRFTVHLPTTSKCCERRFRPMFDFRWGWRCIDNELLFEHRPGPIRLYCAVAFTEKDNAPDAVA